MLALSLFAAVAQVPDLTQVSPGEWVQLEAGLQFATFDLPPSPVGDSRLRVLRADPAHFDLALRASVAGDGGPMTAMQWVEHAGLVAVVNPSMFHPDGRSTALMRDATRSVQPRRSADNDMVVFGPTQEGLPAFTIADGGCDHLDTVLTQYTGAIQSIRMLACDGRNVWSQQPKMWSHAVVALDGSGRLLFLHARSPYTTHDFIDHVRALPLDVRRMQYAEGGPEASLAIRTSTGMGEWFGSYETGFFESDANDHAWPLPNVLGLVRTSRTALDTPSDGL